MSRTALRPTAGRYDGRAARVPGGAVARAVPSLNVRTRVGNVPNPLAPDERVAVTINRKVDVLEDERSHRRISEGAYRTGRLIQQAFEVSIRSSSNWLEGSGGSPIEANENRIAKGCEIASRAAALERRLIDAVGAMGAKHIRRVLGDGLSFREVAAIEARGAGERATSVVATRFRGLLEDVTTHWAARGAVR